MWSNWSTEQKINVLTEMDSKAMEYGDQYSFDTLWQDYGGGTKETQKETQAWRREIAEDDDKFINALYAFAVTMIFSTSWLSKKRTERR